MIELIMLVGMPFLVKVSTGVIKQVSLVANASYRIAIIRAIVAVLSLVGAILTISVDGGTLDQEMVQGALLTVLNAVVATFLYVRNK